MESHRLYEHTKVSMIVSGFVWWHQAALAPSDFALHPYLEVVAKRAISPLYHCEVALRGTHREAEVCPVLETHP